MLIAGDRRQAETLLHIVLDRALWLRAPARAVHSIWFERLAEHGFPTFLAWVGLTLAGLAYALRSLRQEAPASAPAWRPPAGLAAPVPAGSGARRASVA